MQQPLPVENFCIILEFSLASISQINFFFVNDTKWYAESGIKLHSFSTAGLDEGNWVTFIPSRLVPGVTLLKHIE